jgi:hypothetical protein
MKNAVFAREVLRMRVWRCIVAEIFQVESWSFDPAFSFSSFPQVHTASLRGRTGLQFVTNSETSESLRRKA